MSCKLTIHPSCCRLVRRTIGAIACLSLLLTFLVARGANMPVLKVAVSQGEGAIQAALDRLTQGGEVDLEAGTYLIQRPILLQYDHLTLRGSGPTTILYLADRANCPVVIMGAPASPARCPISHLRLSDLVVDGNRKHQDLEMWHTATDGALLNNNGIDVWEVSDARIERVTCCHCRSGGLVTASGTRRLSVEDFTAFDNQFDGLACYLTEDSHFSRLFLHDNLAAGISLDLDFNHNVIENACLTNNDVGVFMRSSSHNTFQHVKIQQSRRNGVFIAQTIAPTKKGWQLCPGTECIGNKFDHLDISHCGGKAFLINNESCTNNALIAATIVETVQNAPQKGKLLAVQAKELAVH